MGKTIAPPSVTVNIRMQSHIRDMIDKAARARGKSRSDFLVEAAQQAAQATSLDQIHFKLTSAQWKKFNAALDAHPRKSKGIRNLVHTRSPWENSSC